MVDFFGENVKTKNRWIEIMAEHLSGTCMGDWLTCMEDEHYAPGVKEFGITEEEFTKYLDDQGIYECDACGWWTYSGEGDGRLCDDCLEDSDGEEDYEG